jgi:hypothetical protein
MTEIEQWLKSGAGVQEGLRLLSVYRPNVPLAMMVERHPEKYRHLLVEVLSGIGRASVAETASRSKSLREDWPFLGNPDCPPELKILAADKITAYRNFVREHGKLSSCTSLEECLETAKKCVFFYCQNRKILSEFAYYKEHGTVLGKHPVFGEMNRRRELLSASPLELAKKRQNLRDAIWRLGYQLRSGKRPDLAASRTELMQAKERELAEIEKLIKDYETVYGTRSGGTSGKPKKA